MKEKMIKTFTFSLVTTVVFYGYVVLMMIIKPEETVVLIAITALLLYGSLFVSLFSMNNTKAHRYLTFKYGLVSSVSKWLVFYIGALFEPEALLSIIIVGLGFLVSLTADMLMLRSILVAKEELLIEKIMRNKPRISEHDLNEKQEKLSLTTSIVMIIAGASVVLQRIDELYQIAFHVVLWIFIFLLFKKIHKLKLFVSSFVYVIIYTILIYVAIVIVNRLTDIFDGVFLLLPLVFLMFLPVIVALFKEADVVQKYFDAESI